MKRILLSLTAVVMGASATFAAIDETFVFTDASGNVIADGSIINVTEPTVKTETDPDFGTTTTTTYFESKLNVKNTSSEHFAAALNYTVQTKPAGSWQTCFLGSCKALDDSTIGIVQTKEAADFDPALEPQPLQDEWFVEEGKYGTCTVLFQLLAYNVVEKTAYGYTWYSVTTLKGKGPSVTVNYIYTDPAGINANVADKKLNSVAYYDLSGRRVSAPKNGVYVKKMTYADGTVLTNKVSLK